MISLVIDTCNSNLLVALVKNDEILSIHNERVYSDMSTKIFPAMQEVFSNAGILPNDIDNILVANGPGSFTGIRIGVTVAKTYAWALKKKIIPFSSLELIATTKIDEDYIVPIINARRDAVYAGIYNEHLDNIFDDIYISIDDLKQELEGKRYAFISYDEFDNLEVYEPCLNVLKIVNKHKLDSGVNPHSLNPNYLKMTEAEMNLKKND